MQISYFSIYHPSIASTPLSRFPETKRQLQPIRLSSPILIPSRNPEKPKHPHLYTIFSLAKRIRADFHSNELARGAAAYLPSGDKPREPANRVDFRDFTHSRTFNPCSEGAGTKNTACVCMNECMYIQTSVAAFCK